MLIARKEFVLYLIVFTYFILHSNYIRLHSFEVKEFREREGVSGDCEYTPDLNILCEVQRLNILNKLNLMQEEGINYGFSK